jgi:hypothetical protein
MKMPVRQKILFPGMQHGNDSRYSTEIMRVPAQVNNGRRSTAMIKANKELLVILK